MQPNGALTIQDINGNILWTTQLITTSSFGGYYLKMQDDQNLVIYDTNNIPYWAIFGNFNGIGQLLTNYWSMSNLSDIISGSDLYGGSNYSFTTDRFGNNNSAIYFNNGFLQVPNGSYFSGDFTIMTWIYLISYQYSIRIMDFGNGAYNNNVYLAIGSKYSPDKSIDMGIYSSSSSGNEFSSVAALNLNQWYHIAVVLSVDTAYAYINGVQDTSGFLLSPVSVTRTSNYIGKSNWPYDSNANAIYDEIKIFNGALYSDMISTDFQFSSYQSFNLINYWPMSNLSDIISGSDLYGGSNYSFTTDRFGNNNSAIYFNNGFLKVPNGSYFNGDFTIIIWVNFKAFESMTRFIDFQDQNGNNNVAFSMDSSGILLLLQTSDNTTLTSVNQFYQTLLLNTWYHVTAVLQGTNAYIYVNGVLQITGTLSSPSNVTRTMNFIGQCNSNGNTSTTNAIFDDIKIFKGGMSGYQVLNDYITNKACKFSFAPDNNNLPIYLHLLYFYLIYLYLPYILFIAYIDILTY